MKYFFLLLFVLNSSYWAFPQETFEKIFRGFAGSDESWGSCVAQTIGQNYMISAHVSIVDQSGFIMIKTNHVGDTIKTIYFDGWSESFSVTSDGGLIITGGVNGKLIMLKTTSELVTEWFKTLDVSGTTGKKVVQKMDSGYVFVGIHGYNPNINKMLVVVNTDKNGDTIWTKHMGGYNGDFNPASIQISTDNNIIISGTLRTSLGGPASVFLLKLDSFGDSIWMKSYQHSSYSFGYSVMKVDNGYLLAGIDDPSGETSQLFLVRTDEQGDTIWTKVYTCIYNSGILDATKLTTGGYIIAGSQIIDSTNSDVCLIKINENGDTLWTKTIGTAADEIAMSVKQTTDDGFVISGYTGDYPTKEPAVYFVKTDSIGRYSPSAIEIKHLNDLVNIFPNPCKKSFSIEAKSKIRSVELYGPKGGLINSFKYLNSRQSLISISLNGYPNGSYYIQVSTDKTRILKKLIKIE